MNLQVIVALAQIVSALAVLLTLVVLIISIRQNTRSQKALVVDSLAAAITSINVPAMESPVLGSALAKVTSDWNSASREERVMAHYAPKALAFDLAPPLQHRRADIESGLREWFATWAGPIGYETRDLVITADGDVAFAHSLNRFSGTRTDGTATDVWFRATVCLRKLAGGVEDRARAHVGAALHGRQLARRRRPAPVAAARLPRAHRTP